LQFFFKFRGLHAHAMHTRLAFCCKDLRVRFALGYFRSEYRSVMNTIPAAL